MAQILPIAQLGHPILREMAQMVDDLSDPAVQDLMDNLLTTMAERGSIGLAAPQVHQSLRIIIISSRPTPIYSDAAYLEPLIMVNPELIGAAEELAKGWEGCASIPGIRGLVPRSNRVVVEYTTQEGTGVNLELSDLAARVFLHELDHLNGLVFLDRLESTRDIVCQKELLKRYA